MRKMRGTVHLEKTIGAHVARVYGAFQRSAALRVWYDPRCRLYGFRVGEKLAGDNYPSAEIVALVPNHLIVHRYTETVSGLGVWSFVEKRARKATLLILDHIDAYDDEKERESVEFYWRGLMENLAAFCENRELPFDHDTGEYKPTAKARDLQKRE
jgi:uncharacterized protein YndB with AHSA1/START domain